MTASRTERRTHCGGSQLVARVFIYLFYWLQTNQSLTCLRHWYWGGEDRGRGKGSRRLCERYYM